MDTREKIQHDLGVIFEYYDLKVEVGISRHGVTIRSQDAKVDATNQRRGGQRRTKKCSKKK